ncbi:MAG: phosphotransferase [Firmicutes bacterium]|nr:phosphotransferase [Bacillota bacterium]
MAQKSLYKKLGDEVKRIDSYFIFQQIQEIVEENYDLGKLVEVFEIFGGYTSRAFRITLEKGGERKDWFFRKYMKIKPETEVLFEHYLLLHARKNGFQRTAVPIATKDGKTYVSRIQGEKDFRRQHYFTIYEYFSGEDTYDWVYNEMPLETDIDIAEMFAELHHSSADFDTQGLNGDEPPILEFNKQFPDKWLFYKEEYAKAGLKDIFTDYFSEQFDYVVDMSKRLDAAYDELRRLPIIPIQCDLHPGNLKFKGDKCVAIFDFEAAKLDLRLFDVCLGVTNCFASWKPGIEGHIYLDRMEAFLRAYNNRLKELGGLSPINEAEKKHFCEVLQLSNMYMVQWAARVYHSDMASNPYEFYFYLRHQIGCVEWIEKNHVEIASRL